MRTEPDLDRAGLIDFLHERYGLDIGALEFVPMGLDSWSYAATLTDGDRVFLKLGRRTLGPGTAPFGAELPLLAALADLGRVPVARPIADRDGRFVNVLDGSDLCVLEFLDGRSLENETAWPAALYANVAETLGAIHASTEAVRHLVPRTETYDLPFLPPLKEALAAVATSTTDLRGLVLPHALDVHTAVVRLEELRDLARLRQGEEVLCHTDFWGSNLLLSKDGTLHVLDWNGALLAPAEHDLSMFAGTDFFPGERLGWFLDRYEAAFRPIHLDADVLGFYLLRRNLEDLAWFLEWLIDDNTEAMDRAGQLRIVASQLAELPRLEERIRNVRQVLEERRRS